MKGVGPWVWRNTVHFAHHPFVTGLGSLAEKVFIEQSSQPAFSILQRNHDSIDVDEALVARVEPEEVRAAVARAVIKASKKAPGPATQVARNAWSIRLDHRGASR